MTTTTLRITAEDVTPDQHSALIQLLRDSGLRQDQITVEHSDEAPSGPLRWVALLLFAATVAMLLGWVWIGDWRWGPTAAIAFVGGFVCLGFSISKGKR